MPGEIDTKRTNAERKMLHLSKRDPAVFFEAIIKPPAPSERLARAFAEYRRRLGA